MPALIFINVNMQRVRQNRKYGTRQAVIRISKGRHGKPVYAKEVEIDGPVTLKYEPERPLPCGARVYMTTLHRVKIVR